MSGGQLEDEDGVVKMPASRVDKFSAGKTKYRSPMEIRTWWNGPALFLSSQSRVLKPYLRLDLINPRSSSLFPFLVLSKLPSDSG